MNPKKAAVRTANGVFEAWEKRTALVKLQVSTESAANDAKTIRLKRPAPGRSPDAETARIAAENRPARSAQEALPSAAAGSLPLFSDPPLAPNIATASRSGLGPHRLMLRPRESHELRLVSSEITTSPPAALNLGPGRVRQLHRHRRLRHRQRHA